MPKPIPPELLAQYARAFHEIRETYRNGVEVNLPPEEILSLPIHHPLAIKTRKPDAALTRGPCVVRDLNNTFAERSALVAADSHYEYDECFKPIPEIAALIAYLEELP